MSYIRCLCNPESLYVWEGADDHHHFSWTDQHGKQQLLKIPSDDFDEFFRRFRKWEDWTAKELHSLDCETFMYSGIKVRTVIFDEKLKHVVTNKKCESYGVMNYPNPVSHLICLTYQCNKPILMWEVTWDRLRDSVYNYLFRPCWFVRKINKWFGP
ncbi:hypothetical protein LCGC14_0142870 [marine sediment metagenome]|uniref:Uncharacterized protein n=1 Tax=marine sediment metagenome TaxID=412755 RepID=A0A0F9VGS5_9ZZZZ